MSSIRLTEYSHGAGCGCKLSPEVLKQLVTAVPDHQRFADLLVGNQSADDAAVVKINDTQAVVSTTDFFMPIVDDPRDFGRIAATNAISDIYAMGATPIMAIAIFGWPIDKLDASVGKLVLDGGREVCHELGFPLAGGHSIDSPEPIFGLSVTGIIEIDRIKRNNTAQIGDRLFLTKPIGIGIVTTAQKRGHVTDADIQEAISTMTSPNVFGKFAGATDYVNAMTDVTGFGLAGHAAEFARGSGVGIELNMNGVPLLNGVSHYQSLGCIPGGALRNEASLGTQLIGGTPLQRQIACDPQTSGGLLLSVAPQGVEELSKLARTHNVKLVEVGRVTEGANVTLV